MKRARLPLLYIASFLFTILPVLIYFLVNFEKYVSTTSDAVKLSFGGVILTVIIVLKVIGKLKIPSRVVLFSVLFLLGYLFSSIINDLLIFLFLALVGEILDAVCQIFIKREKAREEREAVAKETARAVGEALSGRV